MSGDRNNTIRAPRPRRAGRTACLAAGLSLAAIGLAFTPLPAQGDPATTAPAEHSQPADSQAQQAAQPLRGSGAADAARAGARARDGRPTTGPALDPAAIPWDEIAAFMRQHSPLKWERWEQFNRVNPGSSRGEEVRQQVRDGIRGQYAQLKKIESADPDEYKLEVHRVEIEDGMFGAAADYRRGAGDAAKRGLATQQMEQHVRDLLDLRDQLQKHRLERRKAELARQSERVEKQLASLEQKPKTKEQQITALAKRLLNDQPAPLWGGPGSGPGGGGSPRSGQPRRDGAPNGREQRSGRAGPTTNRSADEESSGGEK